MLLIILKVNELIRIRNIALTPLERKSITNDDLCTNIDRVKQFFAKRYKLEIETIKEIRIIKESIDARKSPMFIYTFDLVLNSSSIEQSILNKIKNSVLIDENNVDEFFIGKHITHKKISPLIVGMGPAGLFAALEFLENSVVPTIVEQGSPIEERIVDVDTFINQKLLNTYSNMQFGEGGAGTFSDAKLSTGVSSPLISKILKTFVRFGAPENITYKAMPHIGTDIIREVIKNIRDYLISNGVRIYFNTKFIDFELDSGKITSAICFNTKSQEKIAVNCNRILLCIGHSARETIEMLYNKGVQMQQKPFAIGLRIEHLQEEVNKSRYHNYYNFPILGSASYNLNVRTPDGRGVYSFCMCPGGEIVLACSENNKIVSNGMSYYDRAGNNANSAILVGVRPDDFQDTHPLSGIALQREIESKAFNLTDKKYIAPVQTVGSFLNDSQSYELGKIIPSCKNGYKLCDIKQCLPDFITKNIKYALPLLANKMDCFSSKDAVLTAVETRSSSPVKILRDENYMCTINGLYGAGEGSGYSGGIMSSAIDGIKVANKMCEESYEI